MALKVLTDRVCESHSAKRLMERLGMTFTGGLCICRRAWLRREKSMMVLCATTLILVGCVVSDAWAQAEPDPVFDATGYQKNHYYFSALPFENVSTASGVLSLTFTDLILPGNAGAELRFVRSFNSRTGHGTFGIAGVPLRVTDWAWPDNIANDTGRHFTPRTEEVRSPAHRCTLEAGWSASSRSI